MGVRAHRPARCCGSTSATASTAPAARGPSPTTARPSSSARTAPRRSPRRPRPSASPRGSSPSTRSPSCGRAQRPLARPAGPAHRADGAGAPGDDHYGPIALGRRVRADRRASCSALGQPDRGRLLHLGPHEQRGRVPLPAVRARVRHQQPARLLEHVPRVERRRRSARRSASARAPSRSTTSTHAELIIVVGQNPGTNHPRMLTALEQAKRNGAPDRRGQPAARGRADARSRNPQTRARAWSGAAPRSPTCFLQIRVGGDLALFQAAEPALLELTTRRRGARPRLRRRAQRRASTSCAAHLRARSTGPTCSSATGLAGDADRASCADAGRRRRARSIVCWAMGLTQHSNAVATIREIVNLLLLRGNIGRPGRRRCARCAATATCRATARWASGSSRPSAFLDALRRRVRLRAAARARAATPSTRSGRCATAGSRCSSRWAATSPSATPDTEVTEAALRRLRADRARLDQAQPLAPRAPGAQALILPCLGRTERDMPGAAASSSSPSRTR